MLNASPEGLEPSELSESKATFLERAANKLYAWICEHEGLAAAGLIALLTLLALAFAIRRWTWIDEYFILYTALLPSVGAIWKALSVAPLPLDPPLFTWMAHFACQLFPNKELAIRLPSVLSYALTLVFLYRIVRRYSDAVAGLLAIVLTAATLLFRYSHEARPYSLLLAAGTAALYCWLSASEREDGRMRYLLGLFLSLAVCVSLHWYAGLLVLPLLCGELVRTLGRRRLDWAVLIAVVAGCAVVLLYLPLLPGMSRYQGLAWRSATWADVYLVYGSLFKDGVTAALCGLLGVALVALLNARPWTRSGESRGVPVEHIVAFASLTLLPVGGIVLSFAVRSAFEARYVLGGIIGVIILTVLGSYSALRGRALLLLAALVCAGAGAILGTLLQLRHEGPDARILAPLGPELGQLADYPIAVDYTPMFLRLCNHGPEQLRTRFVLLGDIKTPDGQGTTIFSLINAGLHHASKLPIVDSEEFLTQHGAFYYLINPGDERWCLRAAGLRARQREIKYVGSYLEDEVELFLVTPARVTSAEDAISAPATRRP